MASDRSLVDLLFQVRITCGRKALVVSVAANSPNAVVISIPLSSFHGSYCPPERLIRLAASPHSRQCPVSYVETRDRRPLRPHVAPAVPIDRETLVTVAG